eukprot:15366906-Ditylum_brightwellii.AAC.1
MTTTRMMTAVVHLRYFLVSQRIVVPIYLHIQKKKVKHMNVNGGGNSKENPNMKQSNKRRRRIIIMMRTMQVFLAY